MTLPDLYLFPNGISTSTVSTGESNFSWAPRPLNQSSPSISSLHKSRETYNLCLRLISLPSNSNHIIPTVLSLFPSTWFNTKSGLLVRPPIFNLSILIKDAAASVSICALADLFPTLPYRWVLFFPCLLKILGLSFFPIFVPLQLVGPAAEPCYLCLQPR